MAQEPKMTPTQGLLMLAAIVGAVAAFIGITTLAGITETWAGLLLVFYWGTFEDLKLERLPMSGLGALLGTCAAALTVLLPPKLGTTIGTVIPLGLILLLLYAFIMGWFLLAVNRATMLFVTVASFPHITKNASIAGSLISVAAGITFFGAIATILELITRRRSRHQERSPLPAD
jgi:hypothetical protein